MKKILIFFFVFGWFLSPIICNAQSHEITQLILNYEKLRQLEKILDNMYKGYEILTKGYNTIRDIAEGNFNLHQLFLDGLLEVNPAVANYKRIADIVNYQLMLVDEYKRAWDRFKDNPEFTPEELQYIENVYSHLFQQSLKDLDELIMVTTASTLRMSDDERLQSIDRIFDRIEDKLAFLRYFNNSTQLLAVQRAKARNDVTTFQKLFEVD